MPSDSLVLGFDTSAAHCAAALLCGDAILAQKAEAMPKGQAERLMPLLEALLAQTGTAWPDLSRIGVGVGPGNFTGIRIAVSAARGLSLGLGIPAIGVTSFDAIDPDGAVAVPAPRGQVYLRRPGAHPVLQPADAAAGLATPPDDPADLAAAIARLAASRTPGERPAPLYIRPADAAPSSDVPPVILDDR